MVLVQSIQLRVIGKKFEREREERKKRTGNGIFPLLDEGSSHPENVLFSSNFFLSFDFSLSRFLLLSFSLFFSFSIFSFSIFFFPPFSSPLIRLLLVRRNFLSIHRRFILFFLPIVYHELNYPILKFSFFFLPLSYFSLPRSYSS